MGATHGLEDIYQSHDPEWGQTSQYCVRRGGAAGVVGERSRTKTRGKKIQDNFGNDPRRGRTFNLKILYFPIFDVPLFEICILKPRS
ncbi:hypothetical protein [Algoriphagus terrigena]|uniref:hypothetical protein n=1 Tax=Algoriphagus terrigena TaxID=344884 RepID=UPI00047CDB7B|nr:hypothetical protein [Algoriphagus terrigena]